MRHVVVIILLCVAAKIHAQKFTVTWADGAALVLGAMSGVADGVVQAYHADPTVFERRGWRGRYWRAKAWENNYPGGSYDDGERPMRPEFLNSFRDVWHGANTLNTVSHAGAMLTLGVSEGVRLGRGKSKWWHTAVKVSVCQGIRLTMKNIIYSELR